MFSLQPVKENLMSHFQYTLGHLQRSCPQCAQHYCTLRLNSDVTRYGPSVWSEILTSSQVTGTDAE